MVHLTHGGRPLTPGLPDGTYAIGYGAAHFALGSGPRRAIELTRFAMRREVLGCIAMQPKTNPLRGFLGNYVFSDRQNLRCGLGSASGAASRCVPTTRAASRMRVSMIHRFFLISVSYVAKFHHEPRQRLIKA
jgi:hypothetical protein